MAVDYSVLALPKSKPSVVVRAVKQKQARRAWRQTAKAVDQRDRAEDADDTPVCFITGKYLSTKTTDKWLFRDRAHLEARSLNKGRRFEVENVISCSRGVHQLIDSSALLLFDKRGRPAKSRRSIDHVAWNRRYVARGEEPCRIRRGLAVRELPA